MDEKPDIVVDIDSKPFLGQSGILQEFRVRITNSGPSAITNLALIPEQGKIRFEKLSRHLPSRGKTLQDLNKSSLLPGEEWIVDFAIANAHEIPRPELDIEAEIPLILKLEFLYRGTRWEQKWKLELGWEAKIADRFAFKFESSVVIEDRDPKGAGNTAAGNQVAEGEERDVFLCHSSTDKTDFVEPFAARLEEEKISYWLDKAEIRWGDSLIGKIEEGLNISKYVILFIGKDFPRNWGRAEMEGAMTKEIQSGEKVVLPLFIGSDDELEAFQKKHPLVARKKYLRWNVGLDAIIEELEKIL